MQTRRFASRLVLPLAALPLAALSLALLPGFALAAAPLPTDQNNPAVRQAVLRTQELARTIVAGDQKKVEAMLAPELMVVTSRGLVERGTWMDALFKRMKVDKLDVLEARGAVYGDTAIVYSRQVLAATHTPPDPKTGAKDYGLEALVTDVWHKRGNEWILVARQSGTVTK